MAYRTQSTETTYPRNSRGMLILLNSFRNKLCPKCGIHLKVDSLSENLIFYRCPGESRELYFMSVRDIKRGVRYV